MGRRRKGTRTEYSTIQVPKTTKLKIEDFRRRHGYPSYSQAVTALVERVDVAEDVKEALLKGVKEALIEEATRTIARLFYEIMIDILKRADKPVLLHLRVMRDKKV